MVVCGARPAETKGLIMLEKAPWSHAGFAPFCGVFFLFFKERVSSDISCGFELLLFVIYVC